MPEARITARGRPEASTAAPHRTHRPIFNRLLGLTDILVLPHHDRAGRAERHAKAQLRFGDRVKLLPLRDGELVIQEGERATVLRR